MRTARSTCSLNYLAHVGTAVIKRVAAKLLEQGPLQLT